MNLAKSFVRLRTRTVLASLLLLPIGGAACDGGDGMGDSPVTFAGSWSGSRVTMAVDSANRLTSFALDARLGPCEGTLVDQPDAPIDNGSFQFSLSDSGASTFITGKFEGDAVSGTYGTLNYSIICGSSFVVGTTSGGAWSATRVKQ
jgi:hypothetical protein